MTLFEKAVLFAGAKHQGMTRKLDSMPYILHPMEAALIVWSMTDDDEVLAAAMLHDTVEDTDTTLEEIKLRFGERVAELVASETENKRPGIPKSESWAIRKRESLLKLENARDIGVKYLWLADKLSNMRTLYKTWKEKKEGVFASFNQSDPAAHARYYRRICVLLEELSGFDAWKELRSLVDTVFAEVEE